MSSEKIRIFIGSGEQSLLERKVLIYSLRKHTRRELDIKVFNGSHNSIESEDSEPVQAPLSLRLKYRNLTEFSLYRYLIPEVCNYEGRAIYLDSDMVCLRDIGLMFDTDLNDFDFLAKRERSDDGSVVWGLSAMLINCERCRFPLQEIFSEIDRGLYSYSDFSFLTSKFLAVRHYVPGELDPNWNVFDRMDSETKLIHYTNLYSQPWKFTGHPYGEIWFSYLEEARQAGLVSDRDINLTIMRGYARADLLEGNTRPLSAKVKALVRAGRQVLAK